VRDLMTRRVVVRAPDTTLPEAARLVNNVIPGRRYPEYWW
jgi:hypothetical protein